MQKSKYSREHIQIPDRPIPLELVNIISNSENPEVADIGCGDGVTIESLIKKNLIDKNRIIGIDIDTGRIERASLRNHGVSFFLAKKNRLPSFSRKRNICYSLMVIEHVEDDARFLREIRKRLKPNGYVFINTVIKSKRAWYFYKNNKNETVLDPTHVREYTSQKDVENLLTNVGFDRLHTKIIPLTYSLSELFAKAIMRVGLINTEKTANFFVKPGIFKSLRALEIPIPGYFEIRIWGQKTI